MHIKKYGHACLLIDVNGVRIITDPGNWNPTPDDHGIHAILVTHEHQDHMDPDQIRALIAQNPELVVITHAGVAPKLAEAGISSQVIEPGQVIEVNGVPVESFGTEHAVVYGASPCRNCGFLVNNELFITGDAVHDVPDKPVRILALPTGGPWMKIAEAIDYARAVRPTFAFPVHDAMYIESYQRNLTPRVVAASLEPLGIQFVDLPAGGALDF